MKPSFVFVAAALLGFLVATPWAEARPPSQFPLEQKVRGQAERFRMADAGWSGIYGSGLCITGADVTANMAGQVVQFIPSAAVCICVDPSDAGCSCTQSVSDKNYGEPISAGGTLVMTLKDDAATVCQSGTANTVIHLLR